MANSLHCPPDQPRIEFVPDDLPGMYIEVRATSPGQGTFFLRYKDKTGKTCHQKIGKSTEISLSDARKEAKKLKAEIALGANPRAQAKVQKAVPTFAAFFTDTYLPYVTPRKRSWKRDEELFRLRIKGVLGDYRLNQITRQQVQLFHTSLLSGGLSPASADHHIKLIRSALNLAVLWDLLEKNPIKGIKLFNVDNKVEHYLDGAELDRLLTVLKTDENRNVCHIAMFLLSTGCRLNEALQAKWEQIDQASNVWRIPATNSKSKRMRSVPLNPSALHVLAQLDTASEFDHVFVNRQTRLPYTTIMKVWSRLRVKAQLPRLRIHDLRHGFASLLVSAGRTLYEVQKILGHSDPKVTMRYSHLSTSALQQAANSGSVIV
ncbi:tyrosine-type recombinase/integrase [Paucibacter sp. B2R-40]|uniref:site-specific integrase n=1 Tax=Paucibacter sp. B2R-40 TaxID=2893554 RepID=UPI0021E45BCD|nr:site-specific integrase [Paucibacter sp. B2R-40]MCV2356622.1 tyrosine-type recombinase/integrase [Paucibacter sp. B2R-40]